ncbi:MAG: ROK family protein [Robiginitomaculum sp.]|nr:ROK family protein [Robiginitomaculum sp.]
MKSPKKIVYGGIDAGGTSFKCVLADESRNIIAQTDVPTTTPQYTLAQCIEFFKSAVTTSTIEALGIASFGPLDIDPNSGAYGTYLPGPKSGWAGVNLYSAFKDALGIPVAIDTDVNGALLAELAWGNAKGYTSAAYVTIGTGIGAGILCAGQLVGKPAHPEFGHIRVERHPDDLDFKGVCSVHGACLEGLASGPSLHARFGDPEKLARDHKAWDMLAFYLAQACVSLALSFRPQAIILGGGVLQTKHVLPKIKRQYANQINAYLGQTEDDIDRLIIPPKLGRNAGIWGGIYLAQNIGYK